MSVVLLIVKVLRPGLRSFLPVMDRVMKCVLCVTVFIRPRLLKNLSESIFPKVIVHHGQISKGLC